MPTLEVILVRLFESPNTVFFTKLAAPWSSLSDASLLKSINTHLSDANAEFASTVLDDTMPRFVEDIGYPRTDVGEQPNRIPQEVGRSENTVDLP